MANSKNTIQKIPLNGTLNMNVLKTEVKQFEGFNEKNSTVFGGTLSPFFDKTSKVGSTDAMYLYNSKGMPYKIMKDTGNYFIAVNENKVFYSYDGISWSEKKNIDAIDINKNNQLGLAISNTRYRTYISGVDGTYVSTNYDHPVLSSHKHFDNMISFNNYVYGIADDGIYQIDGYDSSTKVSGDSSFSPQNFLIGDNKLLAYSTTGVYQISGTTSTEIYFNGDSLNGIGYSEATKEYVAYQRSSKQFVKSTDLTNWEATRIESSFKPIGSSFIYFNNVWINYSTIYDFSGAYPSYSMDNGKNWIKISALEKEHSYLLMLPSKDGKHLLAITGREPKAFITDNGIDWDEVPGIQSEPEKYGLKGAIATDDTWLVATVNGLYSYKNGSFEKVIDEPVYGVGGIVNKEKQGAIIMGDNALEVLGPYVYRKKIDVPSDNITYLYHYMHSTGDIYSDNSDGNEWVADIYVSGKSVYKYANNKITKLVDFDIVPKYAYIKHFDYNDRIIVAGINGRDCQAIALCRVNNEWTFSTKSSVSRLKEDTSYPIITMGKKTDDYNSPIYIFFISKSGRIGTSEKVPSILKLTYDLTSFSDATVVDYYYTERSDSLNNLFNFYYLKLTDTYLGDLIYSTNNDAAISGVSVKSFGERTYELTPGSQRALFAGWGDTEHDDTNEKFESAPGYLFTTDSNSAGICLSGHDGSGFINLPQGQTESINKISIMYQNGLLMGIYNVFPIEEISSFDSSKQPSVSGGRYLFSVTYKLNDGNWYAYAIDECYDYRKEYPPVKDLVEVIDNRYVVSNYDYKKRVFDIETGKFINVDGLSEIQSLAIPVKPIYNKIANYETLKSQLTGAIVGAGYNVGYPSNTGNPFIGYIPNPTVFTCVPGADVVMLSNSSRLDRYMSVGTQVQSAEYIGKDTRLEGTYYPIFSSNAMLPVSTASRIIGGYSNNDMVVEKVSTYPIVYNNVNTKIYGYFRMSFMNNVSDAFSLQGQSYVIDDENIYAVTYDSGVTNTSSPVCYKKNMKFLGTLPTQAVFWSDFNKTFYAFTGDRILSKMFEASDINKIYYTGQNPSSLSLWICTDKGIYVVSDHDMYKLNYLSNKVVFLPDHVAILSEKDGTLYQSNVSLWDIGNGGEMVPVKLKTAYFGLGAEQKSVMDCWYIRLFDENRVEGEVKVKVNTITDVTRHSEEKAFKINPSDYDENNIVYLRYQPKYQECTAMQLELESNIGIYELAIGVNATDSTAQVSKLNF